MVRMRWLKPDVKTLLGVENVGLVRQQKSKILPFCHCLPGVRFAAVLPRGGDPLATGMRFQDWTLSCASNRCGRSERPTENLMSRTFQFTRHALAACALAAVTCGPAMAQTFTADEGTVPGAAQNTVTADRISFNYAARISQTNVGGVLDGDDPFTESGYLTKASFATGGAAVDSQLNAFGSGGYGIYGLFTITGTASASAAGEINATFMTAALTLWIDPDKDTTFGFNGANEAITTGGTTGDYAIVNYTLQQGEAFVRAGLAEGDFDTILNVSLTDNGTALDGESFFASPRPFYQLENFGGNFQTLTGASLTNSFVASTTGAGTEIFLAPIPEPETYALMLAGLGALGFVARRRRRV